MSLPAQKLGILLSTSPAHLDFQRGVSAAATALEGGTKVYLYCIDEAVTGVGDAALQSLRGRGLILYACGFAAQRRGLPINDLATYAGLGVLGDLLAATDEFLSFNGEAE
jgi:hypothetical protein